MFKKKVLDAVEVKSPCGESWDEMHGNDKVRFCSHCSKSVNNVSEMTRKEAFRLIRESNGRICVQYIKDPVTNKPLYLNDLYAITRRAPALAAGVVAASIGFSATAYSQEPPPTAPIDEKPAVELVVTHDETTEDSSARGRISGKVVEASGEALKSTAVTLTDEESGEIRQVLTDANGVYEFEYLSGKSYKMSVSAAGYDEKEITSLIASLDNSAKNDVVLARTGAITTDISELQINNLPEARFVSVGGLMALPLPAYKNALSRAVQDEDIDKVKSLIYRGARVNLKEKGRENVTPLFIAVESGNKAITETLLRFGAKVNARNTSRQTPLMMLDDDAEEGLLELLIQYGASVDLTDDEGNTALILAADMSDEKAVKALVAAGADVNVKNNDGQTALIKAAYSDDLDCVRALIMAGADINAKDNEGETALDHTSDGGVVELLESYGGVSGGSETVDTGDPAPGIVIDNR